MRTKLRGKVTLLFMTFALMLALPAMALADLVTVSDADTLQASGDTTKQVGQTGSARFHLLVSNGDGIDPVNGCNANSTNKVTVAVSSTAKDANGNTITSPVTFSTPGSVQLEACDNTTDTPTVIEGAKTLGYTVGSSAQVGDVITVTAAASGGRTQAGNTSAYSYDTFKITVVAPPEQGTSLSVSPASGTYGGTTSLSATLSSNSTGVANKSVNFTLNGQSVGSATTNSSGVATLSGVSLSGIDAGTYADAVGASYAGTGTSCTTNCYGASEGTATLTVNAKPITGSFTADNKTYDGDNSATVLTRSVDQTAVVGTDDVTLDGGTATFNDENAANGKTVTLAGATLGGADAGNYTLDSVSTTTANIAPLGITGSFTADNKTYDGDNSATVLTRSVNGAISGDAVSLDGGTATFNDENAANGKTVTLAGATLGGADAGNYTLDSVSTTTANITARDLTVVATGVNKVYDGDNSATVTLSSDKLSGDTVTLDYTSASFNDENVDTGKPVSVTGISISGTDAGNYNLTNTTASATANITPLGITGSFTAADKVWDGITAATVTGRSLSGVLGNDVVSLTGGTATFNTPDVGASKPVTLTGATLGGDDAGNYNLSSVNTTTASILAWNFGSGFYQPVDMGIWNTVKAGSTVPMKFELFSGTTELKDVSDIKSYAHKSVPCGALDSTAADAIEITTTGNTSLRFDATSDQFIFNWKTQSTWKAGTCYVVTVVGQDGTPLNAYFKMK